MSIASYTVALILHIQQVDLKNTAIHPYYTFAVPVFRDFSQFGTMSRVV